MCRFARIEGSDPEAIVIRFFGIFFFFFQCNSILGNIISTAVLSSGNETYVQLTDEEMALCGSSFCSQRTVATESVEPKPAEDLFTNLPNKVLVRNSTQGSIMDNKEEKALPNANFDTDITKIYIIAAIYLACSLAAALLVALFVDPLSKFEATEERKGKTQSTGLQLLVTGFMPWSIITVLFQVATFRQMRKKEQLLVIPITFWSGIEQGFFGADFTAVSDACMYFNNKPSNSPLRDL